MTRAGAVDPAGIQLARDNRAVIPGDRPVRGFDEGESAELSADAAESVHINNRDIANDNVALIRDMSIFLGNTSGGPRR